MKNIVLFFMILLIGCNLNLQPKDNNSQSTPMPKEKVKPCSREDVKIEVIKLFEKSNPIPDGQEMYMSGEVKYQGNGNSFRGIPTGSSVWDAYIISSRTKSVFIKDSIDDIFSTPQDDKTCDCEATIYRYVLNKNDSIPYGATYRYNSTTRNSEIEESYTFNYNTNEYESTKTAKPPKFIATSEKIDTDETKVE